MAPKAKAVSSLSGFIDSDDAHSDLETIPTPDSNQENRPMAKGKRATKASTTAKRGKPAGRRFSAGKSKTAKTKASSKRAPLKDQTNALQPSDAEEVDEYDGAVEKMEHEQAESIQDEPEEEKKPVKRGRPPGRGKKTAAPENPGQNDGTKRDGEFEYTPTTTRTGKKAPKARGGKNVVGKEEAAAPGAQPVDAEMEDGTMLSIEQDEIVPQSTHHQADQFQSNSRQLQSYTASNPRKRAASASDTERPGNDPALRRKLGDVTRKFETLEVKYRNLRDVGIKEADANFERLRRQSEDRTKAANDLISSLRSEIAIQKDINKDARNHQSDLSAAQVSLHDAEKRITELTNSLTQLQNDNRNLQAKLTAARASSAQAESKVPSSAVKGKTVVTKAASTEATQAIQLAQLKEDLYSDLTGLILRGVDRNGDSDVYDCIQTGRNGTLHFKLAVATDKDNAPSYEETEFLYTPRLDESRDRDLIDILPDYLTEEITFSRMNAAKFYSRVVDTLTRKIVD